MSALDVTSFGAALLVAVTASFHCAGMCGGFALAASLPSGERRRLASPLLGQVLYHIGKTTTYVFLGSIAVWGGVVVVRSTGFGRHALFIACGLLLVFVGLSNLGWRLSPRLVTPVAGALAKVGAWRRWAGCTMSLRGNLRPLFLGMLSGLLPCPVVWAFLARAAVAPGYLEAIGMLLALGLGTVPMLAFVALSGRAVSPVFRVGLVRVTGALLVLLGAWTCYRGWAPTSCCGEGVL